MDKLTLAHTYAMLHMANPQYKDVDDLEMVEWAFDYAEAMLAEEEKRKDKSRPVVFEKVDNVDWVDELEFQVDWSQAPRSDVVAWDINDHGQARWIASDGGYYLAPSFNYKGDWKNSLRERP